MKVLITDDVHEIMISGLQALGFETEYQPDILLTDLPLVISRYSGIVINSKIKMRKELIDLGSSLKFIARLGSGLEIIDLDYAAKKDIQVFSAPEGNRNAVAEHAIGMLLAATNHLITADQEVRSKLWRREANRGIELEHKNIGILGFGNTGSSFAKKLLGFDVKVLAYDKYKKGYNKEFPHVKECGLDEVLEQSDIISLHLPLTHETKYLVNTTFLNKCKPGIILINTSRGSIINIEHLVDHMNSGKMGFVCLDVFENEKPETYLPKEVKLYNKLFSFNNAIFSPHVAGWTLESKRKISQVLLDKIDKWWGDIDAND
jgi:D-3-phosphoglycerate dehydrogenase